MEIRSEKKNSWGKCLKCFLITSVILIIITVLCLIENLIYSLCKLILFYSPLALFMVALIHIFILRVLVLQVAFAGRSPFFQKTMKRNIGKVQGDFLLQNTDLLKDVLARISNGRLTQKEKKFFKRDVVHVLETYEYYIDLF